MAAAQKMTMVVTIQRNYSAVDPHGHKEKYDWRNLHTGIPGLVWEDVDDELYKTHIVGKGTPRMIVSKSIDVTIDDRVLEVKNRKGDTLYGMMNIESVVTHNKGIGFKLLRLGKVT